MFVLTHTADVVRGSDDPHIGAMLFILLIVLIVSVVLLAKAGRK